MYFDSLIGEEIKIGHSFYATHIRNINDSFRQYFFEDNVKFIKILLLQVEQAIITFKQVKIHMENTKVEKINDQKNLILYHKEDLELTRKSTDPIIINNQSSLISQKIEKIDKLTSNLKSLKKIKLEDIQDPSRGYYYQDFIVASKKYFYFLESKVQGLESNINKNKFDGSTEINKLMNELKDGINKFRKELSIPNTNNDINNKKQEFKNIRFNFLIEGKNIIINMSGKPQQIYKVMLIFFLDNHNVFNIKSNFDVNINDFESIKNSFYKFLRKYFRFNNQYFDTHIHSKQAVIAIKNYLNQNISRNTKTIAQNLTKDYSAFSKN